MAASDEKLWRYASLARLWSWSLIVVAGLLLLLSIAIQAGGDEGLSGTLVRDAARGHRRDRRRSCSRSSACGCAAPRCRPVRLPQAVRATGPRRLEASPRDWRRWAAVTGAILLVGGAAMLVFLIGVLGTGGTAEGVVVGVIAAWGAATLEDVRRIRATEAAEGRRYYAACRRPTGVGQQAGLDRGPRRGPAGVRQLLPRDRGRRRAARGFSAKSSVRPQRTHVSARIALTRPDARPSGGA